MGAREIWFAKRDGMCFVLNTEQVYNGRNNRIDLLLKSNGVASDLSGVTQIKLVSGTTTIVSTGPGTGPIRWNQSGYQTGEIRIFLRDQNLPISSVIQTGHIVVYDSANPNGIVWGDIRFQVKSV